MARFLRRVFDRLVHAEDDTITVDTFDFQAMRDHCDTLCAENQKLHAAITSAVSILDPYGTDPWAYRPGAVPQHAEDIRAAVDVLGGCLTLDENVAAVQLAKARGIVECAFANEIGPVVLLSELRHVIGTSALRSKTGYAA